MAEYLERIGQMVGDYRLLRWLGGGGFGNVYLAEQVRDGQQVALKLLQTRLTQQDELRAFINEARTMRLRHPHIVPLLDFGLSREDTPFLVMEYAPRGTLRDLHPKGTRVPLSRAVEYATQVASALQYAHERHLIHRDVKPENMLVREDGSVLLSDFGIATVALSSSSRSGNQGMAGTAAYMPPEQLAGKPRAASDQYALAVVIYEWLAGRLPFRGTALEVAIQHATQPPPPLLAQVPEIPVAVEAVIFKALTKDPGGRFASMQEFIVALQDASYPAAFRLPPSAHGAQLPGGEAPPLSPLPPARFPPVVDQGTIIPPAPLQAQIIPAAQLAPETVPALKMMQTEPGNSFHESPTLTLTEGQGSTPGRKRGTSKGVTTLLLVLLALLIAGGSYAYSVVNTMRVTAVARQNATATAGVVATAAVRAAATAAARATATATAKAAVDAYNAYVAQHGVMFGFDAAHTGTNPFERILNAANVSHLQRAWLAPTRGPISSSPAVIDGVAYVGSLDGKLYAFDAATGHQKWAAVTNGPISSSPAVIDGVVYISSLDGKLYAFDAATGQPRWITPTDAFAMSSPTVANGVVYIGSEDGKLYAFDAATGKPRWTAPTRGQIDSSPAVANKVVYVSSGGRLYAFDAATGQPRWTAPTGSQAASSPVVANGVVYVNSGDGRLYAFDAATGQPRWTAPTDALVATAPAVANGVVYVGSKDGVLDAFDAITERLKWAATTNDPIDTSPVVANGVVYAGSSGGRLYAFDAATGKPSWEILIGVILSSAPAVVNGMVYAGLNDDNLYAFSLSESFA
jgi:outer membrane protein assembly factor BamB